MDDDNLTTILWRRRLLVALCLVITVGAAVAATALQDKEYEARAIFQVGIGDTRGSGVAAEASQGLARSYATVLTSPSFLERIAPEVQDGRYSSDELESRLTSEAIEETSLVRLEATDASPEAARGLASDVADEFLASLRRDATQRVARQQEEIDRLIQRLTVQIEQLVAAGGPNSEIAQLRTARRALTQQNAALVADGVAEGASARLAAPPSASADPVSPRPVLNIIAGIVLGLLLGAGLAWLRERVTPALHSSDQAASLLDVPLLASIPLRRRVVPGEPVLGEAYEILRANLVFQSRDQALRVVAVLSQNPGVGKTSTVEGLAYAAVRGGTTVAIVDGDLRAGTLSARLDHDDSRGSRDVVLDGLPLDDALIELGPNLAFLPSQAPVASPPSLLYSQRMREVVAELRDRFDLVVIDCPPLAQLADGLIVSSLADGVLMVARSGITSRQDLLSGMASVRQTRTPVVGLVMFEPVTTDDAYYPAVVGSRPVVPDSARPR